MKNTLQSNIKQGLFSPQFKVALIVMTLLPFILSIEQIADVLRTGKLLQVNFHSSFWEKALTEAGIDLVAPCCAAVAMAGVYVDDLKNYYIRFYLMRTTKRQYIFGRVLGCYLSGGITLSFGLLIAYILSVLFFLPLEQIPMNPESKSPNFRKIVLTLTPFFLSGGFWSVFGLAMSSIMESKYVAYVSPFIAFYILVILHERYYSNIFVLSPKEWLHPSYKWPLGSWGEAFIVLELTVFAAILFALRAERRLRQL